MFYDKYKPVTKSQSKILTVLHYIFAIVLGAPGIMIAMAIFRHKYKRLNYWYAMTIGMVIDLILIIEMVTDGDDFVGHILIDDLNSNATDFNNNSTIPSIEMDHQELIGTLEVLHVHEESIIGVAEVSKVVGKVISGNSTSVFDAFLSPTNLNGTTESVNEKGSNLFQLFGLVTIKEWFERIYHKLFG